MSDIDVGKRYGNEIIREIHELILKDLAISEIHKQKVKILTESTHRYFWINMETGEYKFDFSDEIKKILEKLDELTLWRITTINNSVRKKYGL